MTTSTHILIITLICLALVILVILALMGKLDGWYQWTFPAGEKASEPQIKRWRIVFAAEVIIITPIIILLNVTDIYDKYAPYILFAIAIINALVERLWVRKV